MEPKHIKIFLCYLNQKNLESAMTKIFQSIMDDPIGVNLRNLNAHGVLEPEKGNGSSALYLLCLVIRLLSMYYPNAFTIVKKLAEKDSCAETG